MTSKAEQIGSALAKALKKAGENFKTAGQEFSAGVKEGMAAPKEGTMYRTNRKNMPTVEGLQRKDGAGALLANGGRVMGVIPKVLTEWEHQHEGLTELAIVPDMHTRKKMMYDMCDAAVVLPGGFGTLDEFFEMLTWNQLKIHNKKIYLLNSEGFYDHLVLHMKQLQKEGFLYEILEERIIFCKTPIEIFNRIA